MNFRFRAVLIRPIRDPPASNPRRRVLVLGYGNPGRGDDGVGPALVERIGALGAPGVTVEAAHQLAPEHAALIARHDVVIFVDAAADATDAFYFRDVTPTSGAGVGTHVMTPGALLQLARDCFGAAPEGHVLGIQGVSFEPLAETLSFAAASNLELALAFLRNRLQI